MEFYISLKESKLIKVKNIEIKVDVYNDVFIPSNSGLKFTDVIEIRPKDTVIDLGTGSGVFAILAAKLGGIVSATDITTNSINNALHNAKLNGVKIDARVGNYFEPFNEKFDVIIANLPQEIIPPSYAAQLSEKEFETMDGGIEGNKHILNFLKNAKNYMHINSRAYIAAYGVTNYVQTIQTAVANYDVKILKLEVEDCKNFVTKNADFFENLHKTKPVVFFNQNGTFKTILFFLELKLKK